jgi:hypothetical protein
MSDPGSTPEADALHAIAAALQRLGLGSADIGGWGAIEAHSKIVETAGEQIAQALGEVATALSEIAAALNGGKDQPTHD